MAHEACKKVARAPHGCWIGLNAPYEQWDNGLPMKAITGKSWIGDAAPSKDDGMKCVEINKDGLWQAIPCQYDRHVLCNVRGTVTRQAIQDEEYMRKLSMGKQEEKLLKASEGAARAQEQEKEATETKKEETKDTADGEQKEEEKEATETKKEKEDSEDSDDDDETEDKEDTEE